MQKNIFSYLLVAVIAYTLGTMSILNADENSKKDENSAEISMLSKKIDKVLSNQEEMKSYLKRIWSKA